MNGFTGSPRLRKGALVCGPDVIQFQYNPESLNRSLRANAVGGSGPSDPLRYKGPPAETISLEVYIDAMDRLEQGDSSAGSVGIYPQLAALELLLYPNVMTMLANQALSLLGVVEILPATAPLILFVWGPKRVIPVRLNDFSITEEAFDAALNPIQAKVSISLQVLTYDDLGLLSRGGALSLGQHILKETLARSAVNSLRSLVPNLGLPSAGDALSAAQGAVNKAGKLTGLS